MKKFLKLFIRNTNNVNLITLVSGTAFTQLIAILFSPLISRLYDPNDFAFFSIFLSISVIISTIGSGRYERAILLEREKVNSLRILLLTNSLNIIFSVGVFLVVLFIHPFLKTFFNTEYNSLWFLLMPFASIAMLLFLSLQIYSNKRKKYRQLVKSRVSKTIVSNSSNVGFGYSNVLSGGLIISEIIGNLIGSFVIFIKEKIYSKLLAIENYEFKKLASKYIDFPKFTIASDLLVIITMDFPIYFIPFYYGSNNLGQYALILRVLNIPIQLVSSAFGETFRQRMISYKNESNDKEATKLYKNTSLLLLGLGIIPFSLVYFFGDLLFVVIFGEQWGVAGKISEIMAWMFFMRFVSGPLTFVFFICNKQKLNLQIQLVTILILIFLILGIEIMNIEFYTMLHIYSLVYIMIYTYYLIHGYYIIKKQIYAESV